MNNMQRGMVIEQMAKMIREQAEAMAKAVELGQRISALQEQIEKDFKEVNKS